jgi:hypothetical protein
MPLHSQPFNPSFISLGYSDISHETRDSSIKENTEDDSEIRIKCETKVGEKATKSLQPHGNFYSFTLKFFKKII